MQPAKPNKTLADYLVIAVSPVLIMLLVGSLCFFLIEVLFRGDAVGHVRWLMFWFVMAVVLVSRIGIEQGTGHAAAYGVTLAVATWLYLMQIYPAFILGLLLLGIIWWSAHKLTWDCTLIDEDEDASGTGLVETAGQKKPPAPPPKEKRLVRNLQKTQRKSAPPHPPGLWVVYFSLAALPLFGIGQTLIPGADAGSRRFGFVLLFTYVAAAVGLLLTTSFLGLRRYLRQRYIEMPGAIAFGWIRFGVVVGAFVLIAALLFPRPGAHEAWITLRERVDYRLHQASDYAARFNPHGTGDGRAGNETKPTEPKNTPAPQQQGDKHSNRPNQDKSGTGQSHEPQISSNLNASRLYHWLKTLFFCAVIVLAAVWIFRKRALILQMLRSAIAAIVKFFRELFQFAQKHRTSVTQAAAQPARRPFASFHNPFLLSKEEEWTHEEIILYSFDATRAWAAEQGVQPQPDQTAREFCDVLGNRFPEIINELRRLSFLYSHAAFAKLAPVQYDLEPVKKIWQFFYSF